MNALFALATQQEIKQQAEAQSEQPQNPYLEVSDPVQIYGELLKLTKTQQAPTESEESAFVFEQSNQEYIITETDARSVYVINVPKQATTLDVEKFFSRVGEVKKVNQNKQFWFVEYNNKDDVDRAIEKLTGNLLFGQKITVMQKRTMVSKRK